MKSSAQKSSPYPPRATARELGLICGILPVGPRNDITDVPGVRVGHSTIVSGTGALKPGLGPVRTGVTAVLPHTGNIFLEQVPAGVFVLNGFGKCIGLPQVQELGVIETPILLTNTLSSYRTADYLINFMLEQNPNIGITTSTVNPLVGECNDGWLNDIQGRHVREGHVREALLNALNSADGNLQQGAVGAGTGVVCFGFKGGIGSSSRQVAGYTLGALVQANFGTRRDFLLAGVPVGERMSLYPADVGPEPEDIPPGSVMIILATDAPLDARQLTRLCKRMSLHLSMPEPVLVPLPRSSLYKSSLQAGRWDWRRWERAPRTAAATSLSLSRQRIAFRTNPRSPSRA